MPYINLMIEMFAKNITEKTLADMLGIDQKTLNHKLEGDHEFTLKDINIIMTLFPHCTADYLFDEYKDFVKK